MLVTVISIVLMGAVLCVLALMFIFIIWGVFGMNQCNEEEENNCS